jgi:pimeloyl-ACP methyl ester carboxylesterase
VTASSARHFTPLGGPRLHVDDAGGSGMPVLFQHGLCGDANQTAEVFPQEADFRRITLEARGHGTSLPDAAGAYAIATFADDCAQLIEQRKFAPLIVGGISMGAAIAMRLAVTRPELVSGLVVARPAWSTGAAPANMRPNAEVGNLLSRLPGEQALAEFNKSATARQLAAEAPDNLASLRSFFARQPREIIAAMLTRISADGPGVSAEELRSIKVPTLIIGYQADFVHPLLLAEEIARLIPGARLVKITPKAHDRARHIIEFKAALHAFLKGFVRT